MVHCHSHDALRVRMLACTALAGWFAIALTMPLQAEKAPSKTCEASSEWTPFEGRFAPEDRLVNVVHIRADGTLAWNGEPISDGQLQTLTQMTSSFRDRPLLALSNQGADCERARAVRAIIEKAGCDGGVCLIAPNIAVPDIEAPPPSPPPKQER